MRKILVIIGSVVAALAVNSSAVLAHVVVRPEEVGVAKFQTFTVGVPNEKDVSTTAVRLVIPKGLNHVSPNVKPGWNIEVKKEAEENAVEEGEHSGHSEGRVTEISWTGGSIPEGQRDDFFFSAQVPAEATEIQWKAYQTYEDGAVVSWDKTEEGQPKDNEGSPDFSKSGPLSVSKVIDDLAAAEATDDVNSKVQTATYTSWAALILGTVALIFAFRKRRM